MVSPRRRRPSRRRSRLMSPASTVSASVATSIGKLCDVYSTYWSGDDSGPFGRTGLAGLALQVQEALQRDPHAGDLYVFRGARGNLIKILWHDGLGMSLYAKRLEDGRFICTSTSGGG